MRYILLTAILTCSAFTSPVHAVPHAMDKQQAVEIAQQDFPGRVLSVKRKDDYFHVKILSDSGDVRIIKVKAAADGNRKQK